MYGQIQMDDGFMYGWTDGIQMVHGSHEYNYNTDGIEQIEVQVYVCI